MSGFGGIYNDLQDVYNFSGTDLGGYDKYDQLNRTAGNMGGSVKTGDTIVENVVYVDGIITTLKDLTDLPSTMNTIITEAGIEIGLPGWIINSLTTIVIILIGFAIAGIIWRFTM